MRLAKSDVIGLSLVRLQDTNQYTAVIAASSPELSDTPTLLDALQIYLEQKGEGRPKTFRAAAERSCKYVIDLCGNKPLPSYTRQDALSFRNWLIERGLTGSSVTRNFSY
ncbi:MAG: integrase, partial [Paracoccaceae bacterium]